MFSLIFWLYVLNLQLFSLWNVRKYVFQPKMFVMNLCHEAINWQWYRLIYFWVFNISKYVTWGTSSGWKCKMWGCRLFSSCYSSQIKKEAMLTSSVHPLLPKPCGSHSSIFINYALTYPLQKIRQLQVWMRATQTSIFQCQNSCL